MVKPDKIQKVIDDLGFDIDVADYDIQESEDNGEVGSMNIHAYDLAGAIAFDLLKPYYDDPDDELFIQTCHKIQFLIYELIIQ